MCLFFRLRTDALQAEAKVAIGVFITEPVADSVRDSIYVVSVIRVIFGRDFSRDNDFFGKCFNCFTVRVPQDVCGFERRLSQRLDDRRIR